MARYAENTEFPVSRSRAEIERTLSRYGAKKFLTYMDWDLGTAIVSFEIKGRSYRFDVQMPAASAEEYETDVDGRFIPQNRRKSAWDREERRRWRVLLLILKAKLELINDDAMDWETEFLPYLLMSDKRTVGEKLAEQMPEIRQSGLLPDLLSTITPEAKRIHLLPPPKEEAGGTG